MLIGGLEHFLFSIIYGMSSFPLTFIFFKMVIAHVKTTNQHGKTPIFSYLFLQTQAVDNVIQFGRLFFLRQRMWDAQPEITLELAKLLLEPHRWTQMEEMGGEFWENRGHLG